MLIVKKKRGRKSISLIQMYKYYETTQTKKLILFILNWILKIKNKNLEWNWFMY